jgi:hypothetical protein
MNKRQENKARNRAARAEAAAKLAPAAAKPAQTNVATLPHTLAMRNAPTIAAEGKSRVVGFDKAHTGSDHCVESTFEVRGKHLTLISHKVTQRTKAPAIFFPAGPGGPAYDRNSRHCPPAPWPSTQNDFDQLRVGRVTACIDNREYFCT